MDPRHARSLAFPAAAVLVAAAGASLFFVHALHPASGKAALFFSLWLLLPYAVLAVILAAGNRVANRAAKLAVTLLVACGGVAFLAMVMFVRPDPQGGFAVLFTPIYQIAAMALLFPLCFRIFGRRGE